MQTQTGQIVQFNREGVNSRAFPTGAAVVGLATPTPKWITHAAGGAPDTLNLGPAALTPGQFIAVSNIGAGTCQVQESDGVTAVGGTIATLSSALFYSDGTNWHATGESVYA